MDATIKMSSDRDLVRKLNVRLAGATDPHMRLVVSRLPVLKQAEPEALNEQMFSPPEKQES